MSLYSIGFLFVVVIAATCNCDPQFVPNPYNYGTFDSFGRSSYVPVPRLFGFTSLIKPLFTYTYSTTSTTVTVTSTSTSTCTTSTAALAACTRRRRRSVVEVADSDWLIQADPPTEIKAVEETAVPIIESVRKSRELNPESVGLIYATEFGNSDISASIPGRTFLISYHVLTSTSTTTSTSTATATATAICSSTTSFSLCV